MTAGVLLPVGIAQVIDYIILSGLFHFTTVGSAVVMVVIVTYRLLPLTKETHLALVTTVLPPHSSHRYDINEWCTVRIPLFAYVVVYLQRKSSNQMAMSSTNMGISHLSTNTNGSGQLPKLHCILCYIHACSLCICIVSGFSSPMGTSPRLSRKNSVMKNGVVFEGNVLYYYCIVMGVVV